MLAERRHELRLNEDNAGLEEVADECLFSKKSTD